MILPPFRVQRLDLVEVLRVRVQVVVDVHVLRRIERGDGAEGPVLVVGPQTGIESGLFVNSYQKK